MNIQEKAEQYAREKHGRCATGGIDKVKSAQDYTAGYNEAKRWIPVGERLPDTDIGNLEPLLCKLPSGSVYTANYIKSRNIWQIFGIGYSENIIEWREI